MLSLLRLLLPALIPSWRFFDVITSSPRIEYAQLAAPCESASEWREFRPRPRDVSWREMAGRLFWNARWNESLFVVSCAERLIADPTIHSQDEVIRRIAADIVEGGDALPAWLCFRIVLVSEHKGVVSRDVGYVSEVQRAEPAPIS